MLAFFITIIGLFAFACCKAAGRSKEVEFPDNVKLFVDGNGMLVAMDEHEVNIS